LTSSIGTDAELYVSSGRYVSTEGLRKIHAATPETKNDVSGSYVATVE
jgi:hypothetical protein